MKNIKLDGPSVRVLAAAIGLVCASSNLYAQETVENRSVLEEIIVTAQRRDQSLQDVPSAVSALSGETLEDIGAEELADYFGFVPSVNAAHNSYGERGGQNIVIRGVANARLGGTDASSMSSTTGFYLNDVPVTPVDTQLFDISRVEVLRGPQGTLYGAASMGGAVKLYHNRPDASEFYGVVEGTVDSMSSGGLGNGVNAMLNIPIFEDVLAARLVATSRSSGGYIDSIIPSLATTTPNSSYPVAAPLGLDRSDSATYKKNTNTSQSKGLRAAVLYTPNDRLSIDASVLWQLANIDDMSQYNTAYSQDRLKEVYMLEPKESEMTLTTLNITYDFGSVSLHSDTGFYKRSYDETIEFTPVMYSIGGAKAAGLDFIPALSPLEGFIEWETLTQEVRLQSNYSESDNALLSRVDWVLGAFKMDEQRNGSQLLHAPGWAAAAPGIPLPIANDIYLANKTDIQDVNTALFADLTFNISDRLTVSAGLRSFDQSTDQSRPQLTPANTVIPKESITGQSEDGTIPRFNVSYDLSDDISIYGSVSEGFRLGGATLPLDYSATPECESVVNDNNLQQFAAGQYSSDSVKTNEIGMKSGFADGRSTLNISAYQTDWTNLQQQVSLGGFPNSDCTRVLTANVGAATIDGFEVEFASMLSDRLRVQANVSFTDAKIENPGPGVTVTSAGDRIQNVPDWSGSVIARYNVPIEMLGGGNFFVQGDLRYMGERSSVIGEPSDPNLLLEAYTLLGFRTGVTLSDESLSIALFIKNATDEIIQSNATGRFGVSGNVLVNTAAPRSFGVTVRKSF
jgi:outer membrane receptor protein involved in Fe transport